ncbi:MAG TPA: hypothetical protein VHF06_14650, partial [Pseudonocardiaceae bacterium]|nr:hypothetical protein [Pseudonocardiaceae bacterium]
GLVVAPQANDWQNSTFPDYEGAVDAEAASVHTGHDRYWNYIDTLNMAVPSFARLGVMNDSSANVLWSGGNGWAIAAWPGCVGVFLLAGQ